MTISIITEGLPSAINFSYHEIIMIIIPVLHENIDKGTYISRYLQPEPSRNPRNLTKFPFGQINQGRFPKRL
jgi:hypothetical protein